MAWRNGQFLTWINTKPTWHGACSIEIRNIVLMSDLSIQHPETPPEWLAEWLLEKEFRALFKPGIITATSSVLLKPGSTYTLRWGVDFLQAQIGVFTCTWRRTDGLWRPKCGCHYPDPFCLHAYAAGILLRKVCQQQAWQSPAAAPVRRLPPMKPGQPVRLQQGNFLGNLFSDATPEKREMRLEVEVDFHHEPGRVGIRFYALEEGRRQLLKLGNVYTYGCDLLHENRKMLRNWPPHDQKFLTWLIQTLKQNYPRNRDLILLNLNAEEFLSWRKRWAEYPDRFLNRDTQQCILPPGQVVPARLIVELTRQNERYRITPFFVFLDGRKRQPYEVLRQLENDPNRIEVRKQLLTYQPPIPWPVLNEYFSSKPFFLEKHQIPARLSDILQGRLDLLEGEEVEKITSNTAEVELFADFQLGKFLLSCRFDGQKLPLQREWAPVSRISPSEKGFQVAILKASPQSLELREKLLAFAARLGQVQESQVALDGSPKNASELRKFWQSLPEGITKKQAASLNGLLQESLGELTVQLNLRGQSALLELGLGWQLSGVPISAGDLQTALRHEQAVVHSSSGHWLALDPLRAQLLLSRMEEQGFSSTETMPLLRHQASEQIKKLTAYADISLASSSTSFYESLCREPLAEEPELPAELLPVLRSYQRSGFTFLMNRCLSGAGCILADDMGLGKTLQVLAVLTAAKLRSKNFQALIICPATVMAVWQSQAEKFCPGLQVKIWEGNKQEREKVYCAGSFDLLVTHYGMVRQERDLLVSREYDFLVLDEAQAIKNPNAQVTLAVKSLPARHKLALTGTPMENRILDLWSIMDFLNPQFFGKPDDFLNRYSGDSAALRKRLNLLMLRRSKKMVAPELPPRIVEILPVELCESQRELYDRTLLQTRQAMKEYGAMQILAGLTRLRQICCDPALILKTPQENNSGKLELLLEKLSEITEAGHSVLVFSQFTSMLDLIAKRLRSAELPFWMITGETPLHKRGELVREFSDDERPGIFLLSLKAAGTGLTLTKADYVFLYDPWWNPAVENQAIDRTHRLGQDKTVMAYRLVAK
ncbi:MAG: DEAD/DEAH box helicase, partial [Lentisphaeria bacterium]